MDDVFSAFGFDQFWLRYPRKVSKEAARKSWEKLKPGLELQKQMFEHLEFCKREWRDPQFVPHPATWLNQKRWKDAEPVTTEPVLLMPEDRTTRRLKATLAHYRSQEPWNPEMPVKPADWEPGLAQELLKRFRRAVGAD
jgi:hypothetical protein